MASTNTAKQLNRYLDLVREFPLRPIRSEKQLDRATSIIHSLIDRMDQLGPGEQDYLDVLADIVEKYELEHHPIEDVSDIEMLQHLIDSKDASQRQVALGSKISISTLSDILTGRRSMNRSHIEKLSKYFRVEPAVFLPTQPGDTEARIHLRLFGGPREKPVKISTEGVARLPAQDEVTPARRAMRSRKK